MGLKLDATGAITATKDLSTSLGTLGAKATRTSDVVSIAFKRLAAGITVGAAINKLVRETSEAQRVAAVLNQTVVTTEQAAGKTTAQVEALASSLARLSTQSGSAVQEGLTRLLTYTTIQGPMFDRAAQAALDMAAALGTDLTQAAETVGKALGSPEFALAALSKQGFRFTEEQQRTIKALVEVGRVAEAQAIILGELESVYAGAALATRNTFGGALHALRESFNGLFEASSTATRGITQFINYLATFLTVVNRSGDAMRQLGGGILVAASAYVIYTRRAEIAIAKTAILAGAQSIAGFVALARSIGLAAAAMQLLGSVGPLKLVTIGVAVAGAVAAFFGLKKIIGETNDEFAKLQADIDRAAANAAQGIGGAVANLPTDVVGMGVAQQAQERVRAAQQELDLLRLTADAAAVQAIRNTAVNDTIKAKAELTGADLQVTLQAIAAEQKLAVAAEQARQARAASQETQDRIRTAQQALALVGQEGEAAALLAVEQRAVNAEIAARRVLSGENLDIALRGILIEKQLATAAAEVTAQIARRKALEDQSNRVQGLQAETTALREQVAAIQQSERALRAVQTTQRVNAALAQAEAEAKRAGIQVTDATRAAIEQEVREQERLKAVLEALVALKGQNPFEIPDPSTAGAFADGLAQALSAAQGIAAAFGEVGRSIGAAIGQTAQLATNLSRLQQAAATKNAGGAEIGLRGALGTAGGASAALGVVGGLVAVADAMDLFGTKAKQRAQELAEASRQFNQALEAFAIKSATTVEQALAENLRRANDLARQAATATGATLTRGDFGSAAEMEQFAKQIETLAKASPTVARLLGPFLAEFQKLIDITKANEAAIREANAQRLAQGLEDLEVRRLVAEGSLAAADAERQRLAGIRAIAKAEAEFGKDSPYVIALRAVIAAEQEAAAATRARQEETAARQRDLDVSAREAFLAGAGDLAAQINAQLTFDRAISEAEDLFAKGEITAEMFARLAGVLEGELARALEAILERARRFDENLITRGLAATGQGAASQLFAFDAGQRQEMADAVAAGMSETRLAFLAFVQFAERQQFLLQRAIEEQTAVIQAAAEAQVAAIDREISMIQAQAQITAQGFRDQIDAVKSAAAATAAAFASRISDLRESTRAQTEALDEQIRTAREGLQAQRQQLQLAQKSLGELSKAADALRALRDDLTTGQFSPLSPEDQLAETRRRFESLTAAARGGDATAAASLPGAARELLEASRSFNASGPGFVEDFTRVQAIVTELATTFGTQADAQARLVEAAQRSAEAGEAGIQALQQQKDTITRESNRQIDALQKAAAKAADDAKLEIRTLEDFADAAAAGFAEAIDKLTLTRDAILETAAEQIRLITEQLTAITQQTIESHAFYTRFLEIAENGSTVAEEVAETQTAIAQDTLAATRAVSEELRAGFAALREEAARSRGVDVAGYGESLLVLRDVASGVRDLATTSRLAASAPRR